MRTKLLILTLGLTATLTAVTGWAQQPVTLAFATLGQGTAWYVYGATMADIFARRSRPVPTLT